MVHSIESPQNFANVRKTAIRQLRQMKQSNIAATLRKNVLQVNELLSNLGIL
ncbi:MAG: hypothetical protein KDA80_09530 [Planctomycetaceae bacterium]|nr:hypothetical protein [Planctomycetaceae bacterium]